MRWFVLILVLMVPVTAFGQDASEIEASQVETFQALFEQGAEAYTRGEFGRAATLFQKAYAVRPEATALYNAARAAQKMGNFEQALSLSKDAARAEKLPLPASLEAKNSVLQEELRAQIEEKRAREAAAAQKGLDVRGWSGVATAGVGMAGILVATQVYGQKAVEANEKAGDAELRDAYDRHIADMRSAQRTGRTLLYSGGALVLIGAGLVTWDLMESPEAASVSVGPGGPAGSSGAFLRINF